MVAFFRGNAATYGLRVEPSTDLERMPVEDASIEWPEAESPYGPAARLGAYEALARFRAEMNARPVREPRSVDEIRD